MNSIAGIASSPILKECATGFVPTLEANLTEQETADSLLVEEIIRGEKRAEDEFVHRFRPQLCSMLTKLMGDPNRAEDLTHDALILILGKLRTEGIRKPQKLTSYVFSTAKFTFYGWLRKKDNQLEFMENLAELCFDSKSPESECIRFEVSGLLKMHISRLSVPRDREILTRRYLDDQSKPEICEALNLNGEHYDRVISRARMRLRNVVETQ